MPSEPSMAGSMTQGKSLAHLLLKTEREEGREGGREGVRDGGREGRRKPASQGEPGWSPQDMGSLQVQESTRCAPCPFLGLAARTAKGGLGWAPRQLKLR